MRRDFTTIRMEIYIESTVETMASERGINEGIKKERSGTRKNEMLRTYNIQKQRLLPKSIPNTIDIRARHRLRPKHSKVASINKREKSVEKEPKSLCQERPRKHNT